MKIFLKINYFLKIRLKKKKNDYRSLSFTNFNSLNFQEDKKIEKVLNNNYSKNSYDDSKNIQTLNKIKNEFIKVANLMNFQPSIYEEQDRSDIFNNNVLKDSKNLFNINNHQSEKNFNICFNKNSNTKTYFLTPTKTLNQKNDISNFQSNDLMSNLSSLSLSPESRNNMNHKNNYNSFNELAFKKYETMAHFVEEYKMKKDRYSSNNEEKEVGKTDTDRTLNRNNPDSPLNNGDISITRNSSIGKKQVRKNLFIEKYKKLFPYNNSEKINSEFLNCDLDIKGIDQNKNTNYSKTLSYIYKNSLEQFSQNNEISHNTIINVNQMKNRKKLRKNLSVDYKNADHFGLNHEPKEKIFKQLEAIDNFFKVDNKISIKNSIEKDDKNQQINNYESAQGSPGFTKTVSKLSSFRKNKSLDKEKNLVYENNFHENLNNNKNFITFEFIKNKPCKYNKFHNFNYLRGDVDNNNNFNFNRDFNHNFSQRLLKINESNVNISSISTLNKAPIINKIEATKRIKLKQ